MEGGGYGNRHVAGSYESHYPIWDIAGADTVRCIISHIDYGNELDWYDWDKGNYGNPYTYNPEVASITDTTSFVHHYFDVTDCVLEDYVNNRQFSQYRLAFNITTDNDSLADYMVFPTRESQYTTLRPELYFTFNNPSSVEDNPVATNLNVNIYPNPVSGIANIAFSGVPPRQAHISVYNVRGQLVKTLYNGSGNKLKNLTWDTKNVANGIYFFKISTNHTTKLKKFIILK